MSTTNNKNIFLVIYIFLATTPFLIAQDNSTIDHLTKSYIKHSFTKSFKQLSHLISPNDLIKFKDNALWCSEAMEPYGEALPFNPTSKFPDLQSLKELSPQEFFQNFMEIIAGPRDTERWDQFFKDIKLKDAENLSESKSKIPYVITFDMNGRIFEQEKIMTVEKINKKWYVNLRGGMGARIDGMKRKIQSFKESEHKDVKGHSNPNDLEAYPIYGYRDINTGLTYIEPRFSRAEDFQEGLAAVRFFKKWGFINENAELVISPQFDRAYSFSNGLAKVKNYADNLDDLCGFINKKGKIVVPLKYRDANDFSEGLAATAITNSDDELLWGFINKKGEVVIPHQFEEIYDFEDGKAEVLKKGSDDYIYIDKKGNVVNE